MIYFLRHGLDDETYIGGWSDVDLMDEGVEQVKEITTVISKLPISKIISSDVKRARTTAEIVGNALNLPIEYSDKFRELDKGLLTGLKVIDAYNRYPKYKDGVTVDMRYPEGESMLDLYERVKQLLKKIEGWDEVLIVTHRGVINMVYFLTQNRLPDMDKKQFDVTHASLHEYCPKEKKIRKVGISLWDN